MEQQITRLRGDLERNYGKESWAMAFRAGPDSIGILAECILITSRRKVVGMEVKGPGLNYPTLAANIFHCATVGEETFRQTSEDMKTLADLTRELSQPDGTIEKMLRFSDPGQSKDRDDFLAGLIAEGEEYIAECTAIIEKIKASFTGWCTLTKALHLALRDTLGHKRGEELNVESRIRQQQIEKAQKEEERKRDEAIMREKEEELQKLREKKERYDDYAQRIHAKVLPGSVPALIATAVEGAVMAPALVATGVLAFASYVSLRSELSTMEQAQARRDQEIRQLEESKAHLEVALAQLCEDSKSIGEVAHVVEKSVRRVTDLQGLIQKFMMFLYEMNRIISKTVQHSRKAYNGFKKKDAFVDSEIKTEIMKAAFDMKTRLIFASKASDIYNAVSSQFILPTLDALLVSGLSHTADHEIQAKIDQLHLLRCKVSSESDHLTRKMHQELKESMEEVARDSARVFEELLPWSYLDLLNTLIVCS
ncbi:hypothetical protein AFLA70_196g001771 [Aspergillus flavus AF70]|nr:hypothetical protein AFLA70_196g001771 [Aspergillus flavus AF70]